MRKSRKNSQRHSWKNSRPLMFGASSLWVALLLVIFVFRGGGAVPAPVAGPRPEPSAEVLGRQADALAAHGDYMGAWGLYHEALLAEPEDVSLWYALGVTLSHLNQREETEQALQYVVRRGRPDSEEVRLARLWLVRVGAMTEPAASTIASEPVDVTAGMAAVTGKITWGKPDPGRGVLKVQIFLEGLTRAGEGKRFGTRAALGEVYRLEGLPAGSYRLTGDMADHRLWDLRLAVRDGEDIVLDLSKENSINPSVAHALPVVTGDAVWRPDGPRGER